VDTYVKDNEALSMYRVVSGAPSDAITGNDFTFHIGGAGARNELDDPRKRYIWSIKIFNIAFGFPLCRGIRRNLECGGLAQGGWA
jgi:hypothetical protein